MKGPILPKALVNPHKRISEDLIPYVNGPYGSLTALLYESRDAARKELFSASEAGASSEEIKEKEDAVKNAESTINQAFMYLSAIKEELEKGEDSAIQIDQQASEDMSETQITLTSVNQWAKKRYGISILDDQEQHVSSGDITVQSTTQEKEEDLDPENGMTSTVANNVLTTFGFLVEAFFKQSQELKLTKFGENKPNVSGIAKHIAKLAATASGQEVMDNQSYDAIRKRIKQANDTKNSNIKNGK